jgi:acetyl esterase
MNLTTMQAGTSSSSAGRRQSPQPALSTTVPPPDLHPEYRALMTATGDLGLAPGDPTRVPLPAARAASARYYAYWSEDPPEVEIVENRSLSLAGSSVRLRFYRHRTGAAPPVALYFHGGGFALNSIDTHDRLLRLLAIRSNVAICAVGYTLAPERRFPQQQTEALAAARWLRECADVLNIDASATALAGDSAGANLALATALALRDGGEMRIKRLALLYGMYAAEFDSPSHRRYGGGEYGLTTERMRWFWQAYLGDESRALDPYAAPLHADLRGLPPTLIIAAGKDCLRDDSLRLAQKLRAASVPHVISSYATAPHSFMQLSRGFSPALAAIAEAAAVLRELRSG